jgi:PAS domain S-box-containing protein
MSVLSISVQALNKKGCEILECKEEDIVGRKWFDTFIPDMDRERSRAAFHALISGNIEPVEYFENAVLTRHSNIRIIAWHNAILKDETGGIVGTLSSGDDVTQIKQVQEQLKWELEVTSELSELYAPLISPEISIEEIAEKILEKGKQITKSEHGYVSFTDPVSGNNICYTLTEMMKDQCEVGDDHKRIAFPIGQDGLYPGLWGHSLNTLNPFMTNSPENHSSFLGLPEGHIAIQNFLSVPVLFGEKLVGQIALANKQEDYEERDIESTCRLASYYALAIHGWNTSDSLRRAKAELEIRVKERTEELSQTNLILVNEIEERKIMEEDLKKSEIQLKHLSSMLLHANEEERKRIGQDLHDGLAQTLSAIKVWSDAALSQMEENNFNESIKSMTSVLNLAKASVNDVRRIIKNLRPSILDDLGLEAAMSWLCQEFEKMYTHIALEKTINLKDENFSDDIKIAAFRILQEALNNISKHSEASHVAVTLNKDGEKIELKIYDDGLGLKADEPADMDQSFEKGIGLTSMENRAQLTGGSFVITSSPKRGTMIRVSWNIEKEGWEANSIL